MRIFVINSKKVINYLIMLFSILVIIICATLLTPQIKTVLNIDTNNLPIYSVQTSEKKAAITFDCAWGADDIDSILGTLQKENVKVTFFMVGEWIKKYPGKVKSISKHGHDVANHSDTHSYLTQLSYDKVKKEIGKTNSDIFNLTGKKCTLFRAPYGDYNDKVVKAAAEEGQFTIQWDVDSLDWKDLDTQAICARIMSKVNNGSIILLHNDTKYTKDALPKIIKGLKEKGYTLVPVSELIYKENYKIDYQGRQHKITM